MVQSNLPSMSAYIIIQYTYLEGIFFFKKQDGKTRQKDKIGVLLRNGTY